MKKILKACGEILLSVTLVLLFVFSLGELAFAQTTTTMVHQATLDSVNSAVDKIPDAIPAGILLVIAFAMELLMRFVPTSQPRSLILFIGMLFNSLGKGLMKLSALADQIVQNVKDKKG